MHIVCVVPHVTRRVGSDSTQPPLKARQASNLGRTHAVHETWATLVRGRLQVLSKSSTHQNGLMYAKRQLCPYIRRCPVI